MAGRCEGRVAVVTGASRGIGAALARRLGAEGARVVCLARTEGPAAGPPTGSLSETVAAIRRRGGWADHLVVDLADPRADRAAAVADAAQRAGAPVDVLVNAAAALFVAPMEDLPLRRLRVAIEVNVVAPWELAVAAVPGMRARGAGWILNFTSAVARPPAGPPFELGQLAGGSAYGGTKAMLERATLGAAAEWYDHGIAVNALAPQAAVRTPGADATVELPPDRTEPVETVVEAALALCTGDPRWLTGRVASSLELLEELGQPVLDLDGVHEVPGWQPEDLRRRRSRAGEEASEEEGTCST